jgi:hypothetical protein
LLLPVKSVRPGGRGWDEEWRQVGESCRFEVRGGECGRIRFARALELSAKDGSIVVSAGLMFVTAEVMKSWQGMKTKNR